MDPENKKSDVNDTKSNDSNKAAQGQEAAAAGLEVVVVDSDDGGSSHVDSGGSYFCHRPVYRPIPPFLLKVHDMLENDETNSVISWTCGGASFVIKNPHTFAKDVLPMYFRHNNFQSFVAQLNTYGFRKVSWEHWEYSHDKFRKGQRHLLKNIRRRNPISHINSPDISLSCTGRDIEKEIESLTNEHARLKVKFAKLKDKQEMLDRTLGSLVKGRALIVGRDIDGISINAEGIWGKRKRVNEGFDIARDSPGDKMLNSDKGEGGTGPETSTLISLEDVFGEPTGNWVEHCKELMEKANHRFKS